MCHSAARTQAVCTKGSVFVAVAIAASFFSAAPSYGQKSGGVLNAMLREGWPSMSIHENGTIATLWPTMPLYNNLVLYDPARPVESADRLVGELAESWSWSQDGKRLTFKLRRGVTWHDGKPFTSADVKYTFDLLRGVGDKRLKTNPRKLWYENVQEMVTAGDFEVTFALKRPQPGLLSLLACGFTPIYPAHVDPQELRTREVGTGPFMAKSVKPDEELVLERNPRYFVKGRPYLDGIRYIVIKSRPSRLAAFVAGQLDISFPDDGTVPMRDQVKSQVPQMAVKEVAIGVSANILLNHQKPPFDNVKVRQAVNLAMDRPALIKSVYRGALLPGGTLLPPPYGEWGLPGPEVRKLPGWGDPVKDKAQARKLLAEAGYGPANPLKVTVDTRAVDVYVDVAIWVIDQLKQVGIEATLEQFETGVWLGKMFRRDYLIATNLTGVAPDDPDADFFANYSCGALQNYTAYCNPAVDALIVQQSGETDKTKRLALVHGVDRRLQDEGARPILGHIVVYMMYWPYVKGLVPHNNQYNYGRMQDVWLDR